MKLYYDTYRRLMNAIKKYCLIKGIRKLNARNFRQAVIYKHFIGKFGSFIAVNSLGDKQLFWNHRTKTENKTSRKEFVQFIENLNHHKHADRSKDKGKKGNRYQAEGQD